MEFKEPLKLYAAQSLPEAQMIVDRLAAHGIAAFADIDQSVSARAFGRLSQFQHPTVWIDKSMAKPAADIIREYEDEKRRRDEWLQTQDPIKVQCEECGEVTSFPATLKGTIQECPHCQADLDVGQWEWEIDLKGASEDES